jgi:hypothetical protein
MKLLYVIYTHNRAKVLEQCLSSLFNKNITKPDRVLIIDDGSNLDVKNSLYEFSLVNSLNIPIDFFCINKNVFYGVAAEFGFRMASVYDPKYVFFIESDYIFNKNSIDSIMDIFENNEYGKNCVGFAGYDGPDFYKKEHTDKIYPEILRTDYGEDNLNRSIMYKPFDIETKFGKKQLELVSNSCGTMYFNWEKLKLLKQDFPNEFENWILRVTEKISPRAAGAKRSLSDGIMSHGISWLWTKWAIKNNIDTNKYAALLNIKPSVADHINGAGINGYIVGEGQTFVGSPSWKDD